jgi:hypothetical protein
MLRQIMTYLPQIILGLFSVAGLLFLLSLYLIRRGRTGPYWRARREAGQQGGRLFLLSVGLFAVALATAFFSVGALVAVRGFDALFARDPASLQGVVLPTLTITPHNPDSDTPSPRPSPTHLTIATTTRSTPTETQVLRTAATSTPTASPTSSPSPSATYTATSPPTAAGIPGLTPLESEYEHPDDAIVEIIAADQEVSQNWTPVEPRQRFSAGIRRIYMFISYRDMRDMTVWSRVLYRDGVPVQGRAYLWTLGEEGSSFFFFGNENGFSSGNYEARLFLGDEEVSSFAFQIEDE